MNSSPESIKNNECPADNSDRAEVIGFALDLFKFSAFFGIVSAPLLLAYIVSLRSIGELYRPVDIVEACLQKPVLWSSEFLAAGVHLKSDVAQNIDADILAIGSSRVMQFRHQMFRRQPSLRFYSAGGGVQLPVDFARTAAPLVNAVQPQLILIGADFWWLTGRSSVDDLDFAKRTGKNRVSWRDRLQLARRTMNLQLRFGLDTVQLLQNAWQSPKFHRAIQGINRVDVATGRSWIGCKETGGFRNDGSYRYCRLIESPFSDDHIRNTAAKEVNSGRYDATGIDVASLAALSRFIAECRELKAQVVVFLPPCHRSGLRILNHRDESQSVLNEVATALTAVCSELDVEFYDYSNPQTAGIADEEFIDWLHASDKGYARILTDIVTKHPGSMLRSYVDAPQLGHDIRSAHGPLDLYGD